MARPIKNSCDYFTHDNDMRNHRKVKSIRNKFGIQGYAIWSMLIEYLTGIDGNEFEYSDMEFELISGDFGVTVTETRDVVDYCIKMDMLFNRNNFIYSETLNKRLEPVYLKRGKAKELSERQRRLNGKFIENQESTEQTEVTVTETPQSKVKEIKEEKEKGEFSENEIPTPSQKEIDLELELKQAKELIKALEEKPKTPIKKDVKIFDELVYDFPQDFSDETKDLFMKFLANRKKMKKEVKTQRALNGLIEKLKPFADNIRIIAIDNSINANWLDLFPKPEDRSTFDHSNQSRNNGFNTTQIRVPAQYVSGSQYD